MQAQDLFGDLDLEFDVPFTQFAFQGVPFKTSAKIIPCVNCLVSRPPAPRTQATTDGATLMAGWLPFCLSAARPSLVRGLRQGFSPRTWAALFPSACPVLAHLSCSPGRLLADPAAVCPSSRLLSLGRCP